MPKMYFGMYSDDLTYALQTIDYAHHEIHCGGSYHNHINNSDIDADSDINICFKTPTGTKWVHVFTAGDATGAATLTLLEDPTITDDSGSDVAAVPRNRANKVASVVLNAFVTGADVPNQIVVNATISADGTVLDKAVFGSGRNKQGGGSARENEWICASDTVYAARLMSNAGTNRMSLDIDWYEHTNK